jgi:hypothetical protein
MIVLWQPRYFGAPLLHQTTALRKRFDRAPRGDPSEEGRELRGVLTSSCRS